MNTPHFHTPVISTRYFHTNPPVPHKALNSTQSLQFQSCPLVPHLFLSSTQFCRYHTNSSFAHKSVNSTQICGFETSHLQQKPKTPLFLASLFSVFWLRIRLILFFWCESDVSKGQICVEETDLCETNGFMRK